MNPNDIPEGTKRLIEAHFHDQLSDEEFAKLDQLLRESKTTRQYFRFAMDLEHELALRHPTQTVSNTSLEKYLDHSQKQPSIPFIFKAAAVILIITAIFFIVHHQSSNSPQQSWFKEEPVAIVTGLSKAHFSKNTKAIELGTALYQGILEIETGKIQIEFFSGATVELEGPSSFYLHTQDKAYLIKGNLAAKVPKTAIGFTVKGPGISVVDLGTEFALRVEDGQAGRVHVYDGEAEVSLLNDQGYSVKSENLSSHDTLSFSSKKQTLRKEKLSKHNFIRVGNSNFKNLYIRDAYRKLVVEDKPILYYNFENIENDTINNTVGQSLNAKIRGGILIEGDQKNQHLHFRGQSFEGITSIAPLKNFNQQDYTLECWINPSHVQLGSILSLVQPEPFKENSMHHHMSLIELNRGKETTGILHKPGVVRLLHRVPPDMTVSWNVFSNTHYIPGSWMHLVAVKTKKTLSLYINGELIEQIQHDAKYDNKDYLLHLGTLDPIRQERQFIGRLDELAIYDKALNAKQIRRRYALAQPDS